MGEIDELIAEAEDELGLGRADAARMLFVALAKGQGWTNARISRYLGVSRARVGQKVARNAIYIEQHKLPKLKKALQHQVVEATEEKAAVTFPAESWADRDFAVGVVKLVMPQAKRRVAA